MISTGLELRSLLSECSGIWKVWKESIFAAVLEQTNVVAVLEFHSSEGIKGAKTSSVCTVYHQVSMSKSSIGQNM